MLTSLFTDQSVEHHMRYITIHALFHIGYHQPLYITADS